VDVAKVLEVLPGTKGEYEIYTVPEARKLKLGKVKLYFPVGTNFELRIKVLWGVREIRPTEGYYAGDGNWVIATAEEEYYSGSKIRLYYENTSASETKKVFYHLEGELE